MRLRHIKTAAVAVLATLLLSGAVQADEIRLATQPIPLYAPIFVAKHKKWIDEELASVKPDIRLVWTSFPAGPPINESLAAGQQDFGLLGDTPALIAKSVGIDTRVVGLTSSGPKALALIVGADAPFSSAKDLKGRKVAVTKGSYAQHLLALVLEKEGLKFSDVELINLPNAEIPPAIIAGTIDAGAVWEPVITRYESQKAVRVLADGTGIKKGVLLIVATSDFVKAKPDQTRAVINAYARGAAYIKSHPREAAELVGSDINLAPDLLVPVFAKIDFSPVIGDDDIVEIKKTEAYLRGIGLTKAAVNVDSWVDRSFAREGQRK